MAVESAKDGERVERDIDDRESFRIQSRVRVGVESRESRRVFARHRRRLFAGPTTAD